MKKSKVGGQAVLEGVMMKGSKGLATAVRTSDGEIEVTFKKVQSITKKYKILGIPIIRGFVGLIESLVEGVKSLKYSASFFEDLEDEDSKFEKWIEKKFGKKGEDIIFFITFFISFLISIGVFIVIPTFISNLFKSFNISSIGLNIIEGIIRVCLFLGYMFLIGRMDDIKRLYMYHGAEHKTIFCYENELELTVENVKKFKRFHPRCGTNFLFLVMIVSILVFSFTGWDSIMQRVLWRIILVPLVSGITYEIIRWIGATDGVVAKIIAYPGLKLQELTTREPDDKQIEVAICALKRAEGIENKVED